MTSPVKNKIKRTGMMLIFAGMLLAAAGVAYRVAAPKIYRASARLKVEKRDWVIHDQSSHQAQNPYDPQLAPAECLVLRSNAFFDHVIQNLELAHDWGSRQHRADLSLDEARMHLRALADIRPMPDSAVILIDVISDDRNEPAKIANEFARLYLDYRRAARQDVIRGKINSLEEQWQAQSKKVQDAQQKLDHIALEIYRAQNTNATSFYDNESYGQLQAKRIELQTQTVQLRDQLKDLKSLKPSELPQVLSSLDTETNAMLNALLLKLRKSREELTLVEADPGTNSPEFQHARQNVELLQNKVGHEVDTIMAMKETDLEGRNAALEAFDEKLKHAKPSSQMDTNLLRDTGYAQAVDDLKKLKQERDELQEKMNASYAGDVMPVVVTAELLDQAETPTRAFSPDPKIVMGTLSIGGLLTLAGMGLFLSSQWTAKTSPR